MNSQLFDLVLLLLGIVIIIHLVNNKNKKKRCVKKTKKSLLEGFADNDININKSNKEYDGEYRDPNTQGLDRTDKTKKWYHEVNKLVSKNEKENYNLIFEDIYNGKQSSDPSKEWKFSNSKKIDKEGFENNNKDEELKDINGNTCDVQYKDNYKNICNSKKDNSNIKRYIRDYVLDGQAQCGCTVDKSKSEFTREEIEKYRESQLQFEGNKINKPSDPAVDPVDKMNIININGGIKGNGKTISDFYDNLVGTRVSNLNGPGFIMGSSISTQKCVKPPNLDISSGIPNSYYTGYANANSKYFKADNWVYNNENPNNGGLFYNTIQGNDPLINNNRMLN